ncbi:LPS export ABC transporter periplasmic protein LptC [Puniceibacterium sp. IMCC21224]|uniref:LPS export ABC transporter periplasmic protein LptC n=1 Tax=Puniceibacterium sp. IMCC21224 TaxID=1618204 RepID=UPI00064DA0D1|nr:LPS export ABC transporter periplasmic protein LptC [Puniceibacterium sp. IMCC21224]KMK65520.1 Lipopolysaccharide-assembly, LptC-like protein [Puniceibacterium sp. IMCC21224]
MTYSRIVAWLKILLPMLALGLLSTIFLLSRQVDPTNRVPFAVTEDEQGVAREQVTEPYFAGTTVSGAALTMTALSAHPVKGTDTVAADQLEATLVMQDGSQIALSAPTAALSDHDDSALLDGGVTVTSTTGYVLTTDSLTSALSKVEIESLGPVQGHGPAGTLNAGKMQVSAVPGGDEIQLLFTDGVKLVYDPKAK